MGGTVSPLNQDVMLVSLRLLPLTFGYLLRSFLSLARSIAGTQHARNKRSLGPFEEGKGDPMKMNTLNAASEEEEGTIAPSASIRYIPSEVFSLISPSSPVSASEQRIVVHNRLDKTSISAVHSAAEDKVHPSIAYRYPQQGLY